MPEVIELVSSSPPRRPQLTKHNTTKANLLAEFGWSSDAFDETGSIDFKIDPPLKKQRLSPGVQEKRPLSGGIILDISSDDDTLPRVKNTITVEEGANPRPVITISASIDDITFSSSAPELGQTKRKPERPISKTWSFSSDGLGDDPLEDFNISFSQPIADQSVVGEYSSRTTQLLAALSQDTGKERKAILRSTRISTLPNSTKARSRSEPADEIVFSSSPPKARPLKASKPSENEKSVKATARATAKADRGAEKEAEKERKRLDREQKAQEKQKAADFAEVNKSSRTNKKNSAPEMIVDMTSLLQGTSIGNQVEEYMKQADIELSYNNEEFNLTGDGADKDLYGNIVTWRRKVASAYNDEDGQWEPTSRTRIEREKHVLIHLPAVEFAATIASSKPMSSLESPPTVEEMKGNLDAHVVSIRRRYQGCIPIYLLEGMNAWLKKNANAKNRQYTAAVRAQMVESEGDAAAFAVSGSQARSRKRKKPANPMIDLSFITAEHVEDLLLHLQLAHQPIFIQHTASPPNTASQILTLTQHLSTRPYRLAQLDYNLKNASFCMDSGQVRTGENAKETFAKMLQEVQRVTPSMAYGILDGWSSVRKLVVGFDKHGNHLLEDVRKSLNRDGAWSERRLGPQVSKRLYKVFMGRDPSATDGMS